MDKLIPFVLEDLFDVYEHDASCINLASSDSLPWSLSDIVSRVPSLDVGTANLSLGYPDTKLLVEDLREFCRVETGVDVLPTSGAAEALFLAFYEALVDQDRPVSMAIPQPSYGAFSGLARLLEVSIETYDYRPDDSWTVDEHKLLRLARECRVVVVNSPHNPTGRRISSTLLNQVAEIVIAQKGTLILDEVFRLPAETCSVESSSQSIVKIGSLSKMYGAPGLRLGWVTAVGPRIRRMRTLQQYTTLAVSSFSVAIGRAILSASASFNRGELLETNRIVLAEWARSHADIAKITPPEAGTTVCLEILGCSNEDQMFQTFLDESVFLIPGKRCFDFGNGVWFRLGYGASTTENLRQGLERIERAVKRDLRGKR